MRQNTAGFIPAVSLPPEDKVLRFSFKHLDTSSSKFPHTGLAVGFYSGLMEEIKRLSGVTVEAFCDQNNKESRHQISFPQTSEPDGFGTAVPEEQLQYSDSWQFCLGIKTRWRVYGFLIDDTFHIVWLDENHKLYPLNSGLD